MRVSAGIRQGCTASTVLFKLVTFEIIRELGVRGIKFEMEGLDLTTSFFADDSVLYANSIEMAERNIVVLKEVGEYYGLKINVDKSKALVYKCKEKPIEVGGIEVVNSLKYYGMMVDNKKDLYGTQKGLVVGRAKWRA